MIVIYQRDTPPTAAAVAETVHNFAID